jgi:signal transduction histidine kinase
LGLAIASELIKAQNGTLKVESQPGQGTVFTLKFPKPSSTGQDDQTAASNGQG